MQAQRTKALHLQAATMDKDYTIRQWNQPNIELQKCPIQQLGPLMTRMVTRNRTRRAEGGMFESEWLVEIDVFATNSKHPEEVNGG